MPTRRNDDNEGDDFDLITLSAHPSSDFPTRRAQQDMTLGEALSRYETLVTPTKRGQREERATLGVLRTFACDLVNAPLSAIRPHHVANYRNRRRINPSERILRNGRRLIASSAPCDTTIRKELSLLSDVFHKARLEWGIESLENPVVPGIRPRARRGRVRRLSSCELEQLLFAAGTYEAETGAFVPIGHAIQLALFTAMRLGELASLRWEHIDFEKCFAQLQITKNGEARAVPLKPQAIAVLNAMGPKKSGPVFCCTSESIRTAWNRVVRRSGVRDLRFHDLRHEAISDLIENADRYGLSLPEIMYVSGHKTLAMVTRYYHALAPRIAMKLAR